MIGKIKIDWVNKGLEMTNPLIEVVGLDNGNPAISNPNMIDKTYSCDIIIHTTNASLALRLNNIKANSMNLENEGANIQNQIETALIEQFGV